MDPNADERLKELLAENLFERFELLVLVYQNQLITYVCSIYDRRYAEDIVQETFINAYKALSKSSTEKILALRLRSWLFTIAHNLALNHRRKYKNITLISTDLPEGRDLLEKAESGQHPSPQANVEQRESCDELYRAIQQLPELQKTIVSMHYIAGLDYKQIAKIVHRPLNTAKSYGLRGLEKLQEIMKAGVH